MSGWQQFALCAQTDPDLFILDKGESSKPAKKICAACPVIEQCLAFALANPVKGVWGGLTKKERNRLKRET
jgi:WhiB family redox-sensing transcriptional regulator